MKIITSISLISLTVSPVLSASAATVITFDDLAGGGIYSGDLVTTQYAGLGVVFSDSYSGGARANNTLTTWVVGSSPPNVLWVDQSGGALTGQYLQIDFSTPVTSFWTQFGVSFSGQLTLDAYNGASLLGSTNGVGSNTSYSFSGQVSFSSVQGITSVHLFANPAGSTASWNFELDNLSFNPVPEPGLTSWLVLGLGALCARRHLLRD
jgi:hypothetical protein